MSYDADGNLTGWTQAESEWISAERDKMLDLQQFEREVCDCGFHESFADTDPDLIFDKRICPVCAGVALNNRVQDDRDKKIRARRGENAPASTPDPADGRHNFVRSPTPAERKALDANPTTK